MGVLCACAQQQLVGQYQNILTRLSQLLSKETDLRMIDNVISCLCRMIVVSRSHVPLSQVSVTDRSRSMGTACLGLTGHLSTFAAARGLLRSQVRLHLSPSSLRTAFHRGKWTSFERRFFSNHSSIRLNPIYRNASKWPHRSSMTPVSHLVEEPPSSCFSSSRSFVLDAVVIIRDFLRSLYAKHGPAFVQVTQTLSEPLRLILSKHLQTN